MKIAGVRAGFATNSSSTHSIILFASPLKDEGIDDEGQYGWESFILASKDAKLKYLATSLYQSVKSLPPMLNESSSEVVIGERYAQAIVLDLLGVRPEADGYIDHQSELTWPCEFSTTQVSLPFLDAFTEMVLNENVAILGGSDNDGDHPLVDDGKMLDRPRSYGGKLIARHEGDNWWTLFNKRTGMKMVINLNVEDTPMLERLNRPQLVDLKLTNFCPYECSFCYQGSTTQGKDSERRDIYSILRALADLEVFEVAIGGGEPTLSLHFVETMEQCADLGIVPNFTTKNLGWLQSRAAIKAIQNSCGAFAYSAVSCNDIRGLDAVLPEELVRQATINIPMGAHADGIEQMLHICHDLGYTVTLLGYKTTGRGGDVVPVPYQDWMEKIIKLRDNGHCPTIGVDTVMLDQAKVLGINIPSWISTPSEGTASMYIDAVQMKAGASSFVEEEKMVHLPKGQHGRRMIEKEDIQKIWSEL